MISQDPIQRADKAEEIQARLSLRSARNKEELALRWQTDCDHFTGEARTKLQDIFTQKLRSFGVLHG